MTRIDEGLREFAARHEAPMARSVDRDGARVSTRAAIARGRRLRAVRGGGAAALSVAALALAGVGIAQATTGLGGGVGDATAVHVGGVEPLAGLGVGTGSPWNLCGTQFLAPVDPGVTLARADLEAPDVQVYVTRLGDGPGVAGDSITVSRQFPAGVVVSYAPEAGEGTTEPAVMAVLVDADDTIVAVSTDAYGTDLAAELGVSAVPGQRGVWQAIVDESVCPQVTDSERMHVEDGQTVLDPLTGTYTLHVLAQFYGPSGEVEATFYDYGLGDGVTVVFDQSEVMAQLEEQDRRTLAAVAQLEDYLTTNGVPLTETYRGVGFAPFRERCEWIDVAANGIDALTVGQLFRYDTLPTLSSSPPHPDAGDLGLAWSGGTDGVAWWEGMPSVVLFFDASGHLAGAVPLDGSTWVSEATDPAQSYGPLDADGCGDSWGALPTETGTYTPVLVVPNAPLDASDLPSGTYYGAYGAITALAILAEFEVS